MCSDVRDDPLNERAQRLLRILVESYIRDGQPVGSRNLSRDSGLNLSSATVRNVMADLEQLGFVASPHTSAGRIPTDKGYRFFVDTLLRVQPLDPNSVTEFRRQLDGGHDSKALVATASQLLSSVTQLAGVVTLPSASQASITHIEFVPLSENRVLAVLVLNNSEVQNRIIQLERSFQVEELRRAANFLNTHFVGRSPSEVRQEILRQMRETRESMNQIMLDAITMAQQVFNVADPAQERMDYVIAGETNLMGVGELSSVREAQAAVRGLQRAARFPASAGSQPEGPGRTNFHRPRVRLSGAGRLQSGHRAVFSRGPGRGGARRHRPHAHGL